MKLQKHERKMHQQLQKCEENQPNPWHYKNDLPSMGNEANQKWGMKTHTGSSGCLRELTWRKNGEENIPTWEHGRMAYTFGFFLSQGVKTHFPKIDGFSNSNLGCHTLPIPCNNQPNQFLAVINDWVNETRKVVNSLMGFPSDIWIFPISPKGLNISSPYP